MTWLYVCGVAFDLSGALVIAWTIYSRTNAEAREEALTRFGANFWVVLFREREQRFVRTGVILLASGFVLQLIGYAFQLSGWRVVVALALALVIVAAGTGGGLYLSEWLTPLKYSEIPQADGLNDERHLHRLATLDDVLTWRSLYARRMHDRDLAPSNTHVIPKVNHGNWRFDCPYGHGHAGTVTPGLDTAVCSDCAVEYRVDWPQETEEAVALLLARPDLTTRNWDPAKESIDDLRRENQAHLTPPRLAVDGDRFT